MIGSSEEHEGRFSIDPLPVFFAGGPCEQFWQEQGCPLFDVVHPAFPLPATASSTHQCALKDGFGEAVVACHMPESCKFPSLDSCHKRFLWTHKEVDLALHPVVGLVLQVGNADKFSQARDFKQKTVAHPVGVSRYDLKGEMKTNLRNHRPVNFSCCVGPLTPSDFPLAFTRMSLFVRCSTLFAH